jgi:hypothetical protein
VIALTLAIVGAIAPHMSMIPTLKLFSSLTAFSRVLCTIRGGRIIYQK